MNNSDIRQETRGKRRETKHASCPLSSAGFSLAELLVVMGLAGVVLAAMSASMLVGRNSYLSSDAYVQVQQEARRAFDAMVKELREGGNVTAATNGPPSANFTNAMRINFQVALSYDTINCATTNGICWGNDNGTGQWVHYIMNPLTPTQLQRCLSSSFSTAENAMTNCRVLANSVQLFQVDYDAAVDGKALTLKLQVQYTSPLLPGGYMGATPAGTSLRTQVKLRNPN